MKLRLVPALALLLALPGAASRAADAPAAPPTPALTGVRADIDVIGKSIEAKIDKGHRTEADFSDEIGRLDALLAKNSGTRNDDVAQILVLKVMLYLEVFKDYDKSLVLLRQMSAGFPGTNAAKQADELIPKFEEEMKSKAVADSLKIGMPFPPFSEQDLDGKPLKLESYRGHVVLVDFWATWCGPCVQDFPNVLAAYQKYHAKGFEIVGVSLDQDKVALVGFLKDNNVAWPQYFDGQGWENKLSRSYGVTSIPMNYLLDADGKIVAKGLRGAQFDTALAALLSK